MSDTTPTDPVGEAFEAQRDRLHAVAHRMLGSHADAEDVVQEAWLRLSRQDTADHPQPGRLADHRGRPDQPRRPAIPPGPPRGPAARPRGDAGRRPWRRRRTRPWPTRSASRSWSSWSHWARANGWPSSCTTCSPCPSTRSPRSSASPPPPPRCSPAAPAERYARPTSRPATGREQREVVQAFLAAARHGRLRGPAARPRPRGETDRGHPRGRRSSSWAPREVAAGATARVATGAAAEDQAGLVNGRPPRPSSPGARTRNPALPHGLHGGGTAESPRSAP